MFGYFPVDLDVLQSVSLPSNPSSAICIRLSFFSSLLSDFVLFLSQRIHLIAIWKIKFYLPFPDTVSKSIDNESVCSHRKHTADGMNKTLLFIVLLAKMEYIVSCFWSFNICVQLLLLYVILAMQYRSSLFWVKESKIRNSKRIDIFIAENYSWRQFYGISFEFLQSTECKQTIFGTILLLLSLSSAIHVNRNGICLSF